MDEIDLTAQQQIYRALELDEVKLLAIMPDCHAGYDLPVGAVALVDGCISPGYVGYDIGCGMCSVNTGVAWEDVVPKGWELRKVMHDAVRAQIPVGFNKRNKRHPDAAEFRSASGDHNLSARVDKNVGLQLGTLGGGNHFIEIGRNRSNELCITIHSGSRRAGYDIGEHYMRQADALKSKFFRLDSGLGQAYLQDMNYFLQFALDNRVIMITVALEVMGFNFKQIHDIIAKTLINENHNHAVVTAEGVVHRKGATPAARGQSGIIPGNMRDGTYVTRGLGNPDFLCSASHGAGRVMGRKAARDSITLQDFMEAMKGYDVYAEVSKATIDESPLVYKKIANVIGYQEGVVIEVVDHITPLITIRGGAEG
jgi:tRNA-splicing ligase RtcB (3'-phosphate/5'-hydroxy nucleic acid ligase)